jgi:ectoine hydroxylase-related dioxygenase (phytanoyl-CoA dioxygenase family)
MSPRRYGPGEIRAFVDQALEDSFVVLPGHIERARLRVWQEAFRPLLQRHVAREAGRENRGTARHYVTLPFRAPFADPEIFEDDDLLAVVEGLVGDHPVMCQLATDTPLEGSAYQDIHRDTPALFPEWGRETPPFQLAVNFALCDVTPENGPLEVARGTHLLPRDEALARIERGEVSLEPLLLKMGDVVIRDVRHLHRGTPNRSGVPRPMVVIGYSRRWLHRPEVSIEVPRATLASLSPRARELLRFNPIVPDLDEAAGERYQSFAF